MPVSFNTIPSGIRVPLFYAEVDNSAAFTPVNTTTSLLFGQKLEAGSAEVNKPVLVSSASMAAELFGRGSMLHRMVKAYRNVDVLGTLVCIPLQDVGTAAQAKLTLEGTSIESGTISLYIGGDKVAVAIPSGTKAKDAAEAVISAIQNNGELPTSASLGTKEPTVTSLGTTTVTVGANETTEYGYRKETEITGGSESGTIKNLDGIYFVVADSKTYVAFSDDKEGKYAKISVNKKDFTWDDSKKAYAAAGDCLGLKDKSGFTVEISSCDATEKVVPVDTEAVVVITAKNKGSLGNGILIQKNVNGLINGEKDVSGLGVEIQAMVGGATDPDLESAIAAMGDDQYDFIANPYSDADSLDKFKTVLVDRWGPYSMLYGHVYAVKRGDLNSLVEFGKLRNNEHETITGIENSFASWEPEFLAAYVARTAVFISADPARPTQTGALTGIVGAPSGQRFDLSTRNSLLTNGIATQTNVSGVVQIERAITSYQKNAFGESDASYLDSETMHTTAYVMRRLKQVITSKYGRHKLADDGTRFGPCQAIVTPAIIRAELIAVYANLEYNGIVENAKLFQKYLIVERNTDNPNRLDVLFPPDYVNQLRIFALLNQFRLQYSQEA